MIRQWIAMTSVIIDFCILPSRIHSEFPFFIISDDLISVLNDQCYLFTIQYTLIMHELRKDTTDVYVILSFTILIYFASLCGFDMENSAPNPECQWRIELRCRRLGCWLCSSDMLSYKSRSRWGKFEINFTLSSIVSNTNHLQYV